MVYGAEKKSASFPLPWLSLCERKSIRSSDMSNDILVKAQTIEELIEN
jgi:hypothetical protein